MADPLSITLATITLATALKDIIELARMIEESFLKTDWNTRNLQALSSEICATVQELKGFCDEHYDAISEAKDMKIALLELIMNMKDIHRKCCKMTRPVPNKILCHFKLALSRWKNSHKIEYEIRELRNCANKCQSRFIMFAIMRIEKRLIIAGDIDLLRELSSKHPTATNDQIFQTMDSNQLALSKHAPEITTDLISDIYLRLQINAINEYLRELIMKNPCLSQEMTTHALCAYESLPTHFPPDRSVFKQEAIAQTLQIQAYLRTDSSCLSIRAGSCSMIDLSYRLYSLDMYEEAAAMGAWALNLYRATTKAASPAHLPHYVRGLQQLSYIYISIKDDDNAKVTIEETISICRRLYASSSNQEVSFQLGEALVTLAYVSSLNYDHEASLNAAKESVFIYDKAIIKNHVPTYDADTNYHLLWNKEVHGRVMKTLPDEVIDKYSKALQQLSLSLQATNNLEDAFQADLKALDILLYSRLFFSSSAQRDIAALFYRLSHRQYHSIMEIDQALMYSDRAIDTYRALLCAQSEQQYIVSLFHALYEKANSLGKLQRYDNALVIWKEMSLMAMNIKDGQVLRADALNGLASSHHQLNLYDEAVIIRIESITIYETIYNSSSAKVALSYYNLAIDLHFAGRFLEAIEALHMTMKIFRSLAYDNPDHYNPNIAETLNQLCLNLVYSNRHDEAFNDGCESLQLYSDMIDKDNNVMPEYIISLRVNFLVAETSENKTKSLERAQYSLCCARTLYKRFPDECSMLFIEAILSQADIFYRFDLLLDALRVVEEALSWFEQHPWTSLANSKAGTEYHMLCLIVKSSLVHHQGFMCQQINLLEQSIQIGKPHISDPRIAHRLIESMHRRAETLGWIGLYSKAIEASLQCENLARQHALDDVVGLIESLRVCCGTFRDVGEPEKAFTYIEEALRLCRSLELSRMAEVGGTSAYLFEGECLQMFSECLADMGQEDSALIYARESLDAASNLRNKYPTLPWSEIEPRYIAALHTLAMRLAANDDSLRAVEMVVAVRRYYERCTENMAGVSMSLALTLYEEAILNCAAGRHEEGVAARTTLHNLQSRLETTLPEFAKQTRHYLVKVKSYPSMRGLLAKLDLRCGHQNEIP